MTPAAAPKASARSWLARCLALLLPVLACVALPQQAAAQQSPPEITTQPANQSATVGGSATFTVAASGTPTYQWRFEGSDISGATSATYTIVGAASTDAGQYTVVATNSAGTVTSTAATLTVTPAAAPGSPITTQPADQFVMVGDSATFTVVADATLARNDGNPPLTYQWRKDEIDISGATSATYTISSVALTDVGGYSVVVSNSQGPMAFSRDATLTVPTASGAPEITTQPMDQSLIAGEQVTFAVAAAGTPPFHYRWLKNGRSILGARGGVGASYATRSAVDAGQYSVVVTNSAGSVTSRNATLMVTPAVAPQITTQPTNQSVTVGDSVTFTVAATGNPLNYTWRRLVAVNDIPRWTTASRGSAYTISSATEADTGQYSVVVHNAAGREVSNIVILTVTAPPKITTQPVDQTVAFGDDATFTVVASGTSPTYQWHKNGNPIARATSATYTFRVLSAGSYTVVVTNSAGTVTSTAATLTLPDVSPTITTQPTNQTVTAGDDATFTVMASSNTPLTYRWQRDARRIPGAHSATYTISGATEAHEGTYRVLVANSGGSLLSAPRTLTVTPAVAPQITTQPTDQSVTVGDNATFTVAATGTPTPTYQWRFEGSDISGATSASYTLSSAALTDAGDYTVVVTNTAGTVTSTATLTVTTAAVAPQITTQPRDQSVAVGDDATFTVVASGTTPLTYQWSEKRTGIIPGATSATYTISSVTREDAGLYSVVVTNSAGSDTSREARLIAEDPKITTQPVDQSVMLGERVTLTVAAAGTSPFTYQWSKNRTAIAGATSATYTISSMSLADVGGYRVVVTNSAGTRTRTSRNATLTVPTVSGAPEITLEPVDRSLIAGERVHFTVAAAGNLPFTYQWRKDGIDIPRATFPNFRFTVGSVADAGLYSVVVTNSAGSDTSRNATLTVTPAVAPAITTQPTNRSVTVGDDATFTVAATGTPLNYQWRKNGSTIRGAHSATYTISSATEADAGPYTVIVHNVAGREVSVAATLTVTPTAVAPEITTQPTNQSVTVGDDATFTVVASGSPTPTYQWRKDGTAIAGAASASYAISGAALTDAGDYTVVVTNTAGTVTSTAATLTVTAAAPDLTVDSVSVSSASVVEGASFTINATVNNEGDAASPATTLTYYRSADATITTGDTSIATDPIGILAASGSSTQDASVSIATAGTYYVGACVPTVSGETDTDNNCSTGVQVTVTAAVAPQITTQPTDQSVTVGENATFTVAATGTPTPTYQWRFEGSDISGATSASYTLSSAALTNAGDYTVVVTNTAGTVTSSAATLTVTAAAVAPQITTQPTDQSVTVGENATFTVTATGTPTPTYQWRFEGSDISGATSASYTLSSAALTNAGDYTVVVTNTAGTVTSSAATLTVTAAAVAPQITTQPTDQSVTVGENATFTVAATGTPTPTYQWRFEGSDISGATSETYAISNAALTNAGDYTVVVTNTAGTVTSSAATLTVTAAAAPDLTVDDVSVSSASVVEGASFTINATVNNEGDAASAATTLTYYRSTDATITTGDTSIATDAVGALAASGSSTQDASVSIATAGTYYVGACVPTVSGETDTDNNCSTGVQVTVTAAVAPQITTQPTDRSVTVGENATFTVTATGTPTPTYQWRFEGSDISGATSASYAISSAALTNAGDYTVVVTNTAGTVTSSAATLTVTAAAVAPQITTQPTDQSVTVGENATFTVAATGTPTPTYQWRFEGSDISGATSASYTLSSAALTNAGDYTVVVTNTAGTVTSTAATLTVTAAAVAPQITTQPTDQSVTVGENATFTVAATGTPTPTYQWRFEGSDISGATSASYTLSSAALTNAGDYTVVVTNTAGTVTSSAATLTVTAAAVAPQITTQPTDQSVTVGENATFTVTATGTPTPTYQWRFEGSDISGATSASYTLSSAALTNAGDYTVVVTNTAGTVTSSAATLTVTAAAVAPQITTQPTDQSVTVGENATFTVAATGTPTPTYQWRFEGSDISGATSETYAISNAALTNAGDYTVVVTNTAGTVTSSAATLTVTAAAAPDLTVDDVSVSSASVVEGASFTINATVNNEGDAASAATTLTYYRSTDATITTGDTSIATDAVGALAASGSSTQDASVSIATAGTYYVGACVPTVSGETDTDNNCSTGVQVTVTAAVAPQITTQPTDRSVTVGENATFTVTATGTPTPTYQWRFEGSDISGATSASYAISSAALTNAGDYTVVVTNTAGTVTSSAATLTVTAAAVAPQITTQPTDQSVTVGENATFTVAATGTPTPTYQWRFEGSDISGATSASYTLSSAALTNAGDYTVVVTNTAGTVTSTAATLTVTAAAVTPQITTQPTDQSVTVGENATFTVAATGTPTPTYQWRFEGSDISGATSASYTLSSAALTNAGDYTVVVTNTAGTVTSSAATLTVTAAAVAPQITTQPTDQSVTVGENATFTVTATGTPTPTYQWRFEGSDISGATSASYTLSSAALTNAGDYTVVVTNTAGTVTSSAATLTVTAAAVAPQITTQPTDQSVTVGENATFTVAATGTPTPTYQWRFEGSDISGATSEIYAISNAALTNAGDYTVVVTNTAGTVTSSAATLTVTAAAAPDLTVDDVSVSSASVVEGASFTINATVNNEGDAASAATTLTYYRSTDATITTGDTSIATDAVGALAASGSSTQDASVSIATAGTYYVGACVPTVSGETDTDNNCSTGVQVTVTAAVAPQITTQPTDRSVTVGENATFTVTATGTPTPTYQWRFEGSDISGATSASYTLSSAALTNAGDYTVVVTNTAGTVTSSAATLTVTAAAVAPQITTQPTDRSVTVGENATFTVAATGTPTPTYQWRFEGSDISGATSASYTLSSAALTNAGDYTVVVTNTAGTVTSSAATLTVTAAAVAPQITTQPTDQSVTVGENATFTVTATGTPTPTYQWRFEGSDISGATSASYTLSSAALTNAGDYTVVVTNTAGTVTSSAATLTVTAAAVAPQITTQPTDRSVTVGENATFTVAATGTPTPTYQWRFEGSDISGATSETYTLSNAALTNAGDYTVVVTNTAGTVTSTAATLTVTAAAVAPQITTQPTDQSVTVGENATFTVAATGTPTPTYQWRFEGSDISGATSASYTLSSAALTNAGDYTVVVTNTAGTVTSSAATLTVTPAAVAPQITTQPTDQSVTVGENATFTVTATGTPTPTYQWRFEGSDISGATSASYTLSSAALTNAGDYTVVVTNTAGTVTSSAATLTVTAAAVAPQITTQPTDQSVTVGENATFTVAATGTPTPTYQWRFEGSDISGATSETYAISNAALTNAGDYTVVVTNTAGTVTSSAATLTVTAAAAPDLTVDDVSVSSASVVEGASFTINATVNNEGDAASAATTLTYYRSTDATITTGDTSIATDAVGALAASGSSTQDASVSIATAGTYHVGACVPTVSGETDTDNNCSTGVQVTVTAAAVAPQITTQPTDRSVTVGENATFTVAATGTPTPTYQWRFEGSDISGATSASYTLSSAALTNAGDYTVVVTNTAGTVTSSAATLTVTAAAVAPQITTQPTDQSVTVGENATFTVTATGTPTPTYQWRFEGSDISGATSETYTLSNAALTNAGDYTVVVTNTAGTVTSSAATLTVTPAAVAPQITTQPTDRSVTVGENATFTVAATGTPTPTYQWRFEGSDISGATSASYTLSSAALTNAGDYTVVVTNTAGTVTSSAATLTVTPAAVAPQITTQPTDQSVTVGENATFTVAATGTPTPTYQWRFEGSDISGATLATYTLSNAALTNAGDYTVVVTNTAGTVTSNAATLTVTPAVNATVSIDDESVVENVSGGTVTFTAALTTAVGSPVVLDVAVTAGTATLGVDLGADLPTTVTIDQGQTSGTFTVPIADDNIVEGNETFTVTLSESDTTDLPDGVTIRDGTATGTITENDTAEVTLTANTATANESGGTFSYTVNLSAAADEAVVVRWTATDGTAIVANDLQATTSTVTFAANTSTAQTFTISPANDNEDEDNETFTVTLEVDTEGGNPLPTGVTIGTNNSATGTITNNDDTTAVNATVSIDDESVVENVSGGTVTFTAALTTAVSSAVVLDVAVTAGTATLGVDLGAGLPTTVTIDANTTEGTFTVPITDDNIVEGNETFTVTLSESDTTDLPDGVTIRDGTATGTITENDTAEVTLTADTATANENGGTFSYTVNLSAAADEAVVVRWTATDGTATVANDLQATTNTVTFAANTSTAQTFTISPTNDNEDEDNETFTVTLGPDTQGGNSLPTGVVIGTDNSSAATITDDDDTPVVTATVSIGDATAVEGSAVAFAVNLSAASANAVTVRWTATATGDGAATLEGANSDLAAGQALTGTVVFAADDAAAKTVSLATADDDRVEGSETFTVTLSEDIQGGNLLPADVSISATAGAGTGTITDNDETPDVTVSIVRDETEDGGSSTIDFTVILSEAVEMDVVLDAIVEPVSPSMRSDTAVVAEGVRPGTIPVRIAAGATSAMLSVPIVNDDIQTFTVTLRANAATPLPAGVVIAAADAGGMATVTITDDGGLAPVESVLTDSRQAGAGTALRRHAGRFDSLTGMVAQSRLDVRRTRRLSGSRDLGNGALAAGGALGETRWGAWIDGAWAGFRGNASGRQADVYGGVDYLGGAGHSWLIGALIGYEVADLDTDGAAYRSDYAHLGVYGGARVSERLLFDAAATYGTATPDVTLEGVSASYDARRLTVRGALTGDFGLEYVLWTGSVRVQPQLGMLYSRERLGAFTDSAGGMAGRELLELGRFSAGPRLTWAFDGGEVVGGVRVQWDVLQIDEGGGNWISGAADIGVKFDLTPNITLSIQGDVDGIGVSDEFRSLGGRVELDVRI